MTHLEVTAPDGLPEITPASDLAALVVGATTLRDGDVVVVTSKVVSKAEGRVRLGEREGALAEETVRVVARRGPTTIVRNRLGLTMAAAGIDASNVTAGSIVLLPLDPDASARGLRARLHELTGANVGVVITDTAGRAWREGQTDIAIGAAGLRVTVDLAGRVDGYGNDLAVTLPAVADEIAGAADLVQGKLAGRPVAVVRGRADLVLAIGDDGPGAGSLIRPEGSDLFAYGAREAVVRALIGADDDRAPFGRPVEADELAAAVSRVVGGASPYAEGTLTLPAAAEQHAVAAVCFAHGWRLDAWLPGVSGVVAHVSPTTP
ncbi:F420-dependent oxidoreductase, putative [Nocardioides sp. CF8]|uniref:coenzyme F420-0:L-glutamate ligase n=1 Tax=Nocardioides sp. CF8 TaxID=110319 RepID=UPI00032DD4AA|nr:coenzyme F420-0:L-glutamate ligase [Nocardioides sp. CF8]EON23063.1 F420-dependent oxidoreductase, putative [Nocardioides sp. CF8]